MDEREMREMLELAVLAAGIPGKVEQFFRSGQVKAPVLAVQTGTGIFSPLRDRGDALFLAARLGLSIEPYPYYDPVKHSVIVKQRRRGDQMRENNATEVVELYGNDPDAAWCLAITRCAAVIGKAMP